MICFEVIGTPAAKGSARAMVRGGRAVFVPGGSQVGAARLRSWTSEVMGAAVSAMGGAAPIADQPLWVGMEFRFPRPKAHFGKRGLKPAAPHFLTVKPDLDKIIRATWDAMSGVVFDDDSRIAMCAARKIYCAVGQAPGASITVRHVDEFGELATNPRAAVARLTEAPC